MLRVGHARLLVLAAALGLSACGADEDPASRGYLARGDERKAVYEAVLSGMYVRPGVRRLVIDPAIHRARPIVDADGREGLRRARLLERFPDLAADTLADFEASYRPGRLPTDLTAGVPVEWFDEAGWEALSDRGSITPDGGDPIPRWDHFHARFPESTGWIALSPVGLSKDARQALVEVSSMSGGLDGVGDLVLLGKDGGVWRIRKKIRLWIA